MLPRLFCALLIAVVAVTAVPQVTDAEKELINASAQGDIQTAKSLIRRGVPLNAGEGAALRLAGYYNRQFFVTTMAEYRIHHFPDGTFERQQRLNKALTGSAAGGHVRLSIKLVSLGASLETESYMPFRVAGENAQWTWIRVFLGHKLNEYSPDVDRKERLNWALAGAGSSGIIDFANTLIEQGISDLSDS
jgi:hypothetical protein